MMKYFLIIILFGCSSKLTKLECQKYDWHQYGKSLGIIGKKLDPSKQHRGCLEHGQFDEKKLKTGHKEGLYEYCQPKNAMQHGLWGRPYFQRCEKDLQDSYRHYYNLGLSQFLEDKDRRLRNRDLGMIELNRQLFIRTGKDREDYMRSYLNLYRISCQHSGQCPIGSYCEFDICRPR